MAELGSTNIYGDLVIKGKKAWHQGNMTVSSTAPSNPQEGDVWFKIPS